MTALLPLIAPRSLQAPLAWKRGHAWSAGAFLAQAQALAAVLPEGRPVNLCQDRLHFALALAAALLRGQTSLMPPNALPDTLRQLAAGGPAATTGGGELPPLFALVDAEAAPPDLPLGLPVVPVRALVPPAPASAVPGVPADLAAVCLLTSGSTGAPQPHAKRWGPLVSNIASEAARLAELLGRDDLQGLTVVATVPPQHSYGLESSVLLALLGGACFEAGRPFYPADIAQALAEVPAPRALVTTPFHLKTLLQAGVALPPVALMLSATAPLSPQLAAQAEAAGGGLLAEIYGCTEAGQVAARRTTAGEVWRTLGELRLRREAPAPGADGQEPAPEQFIVSGGHVVEPTPLADVLELLSPTEFRLLGRANDLIHVAGKRSSLAHLNFHLNRIEGVEDGAFWLPEDAADGVVRPVAFVVAPSLTAAQVVQALRQRLEPAFVPRRVVHVPALPREATGKLTVAALARLAAQALAAPGPAAAPAGLVPLAVPGGWRVPVDHPAFAGHFPGQPVLPGVVLLSLLWADLPRQPSWHRQLGDAPQVEQAKFLGAVGPGAVLQVCWRAQGSGAAVDVLQWADEASLAAAQAGGSAAALGAVLKAQLTPAGRAPGVAAV